MKKKLLAMLLCVAMLLTLAPTMAFAEAAAENHDLIYYKQDSSLSNGSKYVITAVSSSVGSSKYYALTDSVGATAPEVTRHQGAMSSYLTDLNGATVWDVSYSSSRYKLKSGDKYLVRNSGTRALALADSDSQGWNGDWEYNANGDYDLRYNGGKFVVASSGGIKLDDYHAYFKQNELTVSDKTAEYTGSPIVPTAPEVDTGLTIKYCMTDSATADMLRTAHPRL